MVEHFKNCFCNVGKSLAYKIPKCKKIGFKIFVHIRISSSLFLIPTTLRKLIKQIRSLKNSKSCCYDIVATCFPKALQMFLWHHFIQLQF